AQDFSQTGQIGQHMEALLRAAKRDAKTADHLVEDQDRAVLARDLAQVLKKTGVGRDDAHVARDWLDDHGRDLAWTCLEGVAYGRQVVVWDREGLVRRGAGHTGRVGLAEGERT